MSLFQGTDNNGNKCLHITNGVTPTATMKTGQILANTVFHSDLPYLEIEEYSCSMTYTSNVAIYVEPSTLFLNSLGTKGWFLTYDDVIITEFPRNSYFCKNTKVTNFHAGYYQQYTKIPNATNKYIHFDWGVVATPTVNKWKAYIIKNITLDSYIKPITTRNDIYMDNDEINVKGINLSSFKYISGKIVNSIDRTIKGNKNNKNIQLINSLNTEIGVKLQSSPAETYILKGSHKMFSSALSNNAIYRQPIQYSPYIEVARTSSFIVIELDIQGSTSTSSKLLFSGFKEGDLLCIFNSSSNLLPPSDANVKALSALLQYTNGNIGYAFKDYVISYTDPAPGCTTYKTAYCMLRGDNSGNLWGDYYLDILVDNLGSQDVQIYPITLHSSIGIIRFN